MARSEITLATSGFNSAGAVTADAIDLSNDHFLDVGGEKCDNIAIRLYGGTGAGFTATFKAGDFSCSKIGDLVVSVPTTETKIISVESARFKNVDEYILIDASSTGTATAGTIEAFVIK